MAFLKEKPTCHLCAKKITNINSVIVYGENEGMYLPLVKGKISIQHCKACKATVLIKRDKDED